MGIIKARNLSKEFKLQKRKPGFYGAVQSLFAREYEIKTAVNDVSFEVDKGEILGYLGPNGAGKSTTIKMMAGILVPTRGHIEVNGLVPYKNRIENSKKMGVVFGQRTQLWWDIPVSESLTLIRYLYRIPEAQFKDNMAHFSKILGIDEFINVPVRQLSLGQRMRADICAALLHNPHILFLDEPTIGLDVVVKQNIREFIKEINRTRETTVILTTHDMSDVEKLCSRVIVIDKGKIMHDGSLEQLKNTYGTLETLAIESADEISDISALYTMGILGAEVNGTKLSVKYDRKVVNSSQILKYLMDKYTILDFIVQETEIEEIIRRMYKRELSSITNEVTA